MTKYWRLPSGRAFEQARNVPWLETLALSHERQWSGFSCALVFGKAPIPLMWQTPDVIVSFLLTGTADIQWNQEGVTRRRPWKSGRICLFGGDEPHNVRCHGQVLTLNCAIPPSLLSQACRIQCGCNHSNYPLISRVSFQDDDLWHLGRYLRNELMSTAKPNRPQLGLLSMALADYLLRNSEACRQCSKCSTSHRTAPGPHHQHVFDELWKSIHFISQNLGEDGLSIEKIAIDIGMSPFYFARMFRAALGVPPHRYIVEQRLIRAQELLRQSDRSAADVAFLCGFSSQSHLTSTFRRLLGTTPSVYRRTQHEIIEHFDVAPEIDWKSGTE